MFKWSKIELPPSEVELLGFWVLDCEITITRNCYFEKGKCYVFDFEGESIEAPMPNFWTENKDEPKWME